MYILCTAREHKRLCIPWINMWQPALPSVKPSPPQQTRSPEPNRWFGLRLSCHHACTVCLLSASLRKYMAIYSCNIGYTYTQIHTFTYIQALSFLQQAEQLNVLWGFIVHSYCYYKVRGHQEEVKRFHTPIKLLEVKYFVISVFYVTAWGEYTLTTDITKDEQDMFTITIWFGLHLLSYYN